VNKRVKNMTDNIEKQKVFIRLSLVNNETMEGFIFLSPEERVSDVLNNEKDFLPLELVTGEMTIIIKKEILRVMPTHDFNHVMNHLWSNNPYHILGLDNDATLEDVQARYKELLTQFHPDILKKAGLHPVLQHIGADVTRRIVKSYKILQQHIQGH
jgi:DnaJ-domain-containing protein 1